MHEGYHKYVNDLGVAAYVLMHSYAVLGKRGRSIYFDCESEEAVREFDRLVYDYQPPNDFYTFDSCLMYLKKLDEHVPAEVNEEIHTVIPDLGKAAYVMMHEYKPKTIGARVIGKKGKYVYFEHPANRKDEVKALILKYLPSQFKIYDSNLMALKEIGEYTSAK